MKNNDQPKTFEPADLGTTTADIKHDLTKEEIEKVKKYLANKGISYNTASLAKRSGAITDVEPAQIDLDGDWEFRGTEREGKKIEEIAKE